LGSDSYTVFLDLDGTLTRINSGYALVRTAYARNLIGPGGITRSLILSVAYKTRLAPADRIIESMGSWLSGMDPKDLEDTAVAAVEKYLIPSVFPAAAAEIERHKSDGAILVLLSSAVAEICKPFAAALSIDHVLCTEMEKNGTKLTGLPSGKYCYGEEKKRRMENFCAVNNRDLNKSWYYADSYSDLPALGLTGHPVCINPDKKLRKAANEKGWKVLYWGRSLQK
jgi:HAD superfamily hydrolase (TIGR01490 family)